MRRRLSVLIGMMCCAIVMMAQDTLRVSGDTVWVRASGYAGTYADTIKDDALRQTADMDAYLLELIAEQSRILHEEELAREQARRDSLFRDSVMIANAELEAQHTDLPVIVVRKSLVKDTEEEQLELLRAMQFKMTRWRKEATTMVQISQNFVTDNWYQGGNSSFSMIANAKGQIGYYGDKLTWENTGEWREGFSTVHGDSLRKVNTTDDLLRLTTKAGYRVHSQVNVSLMGDFEMHFFPIFETNTRRVKSCFASPLRFNLALGVDYKPVQGLSVMFSPIAYKLVHVSDTVRMKQTDFGVEKGHKTLSDVGSSVRLEYIWKPVREIELESKFYMYTNYKMVELDIEVNCDFIINRFFSARVILHPRYESNVIREGDTRAKMQFKELISIGFAHKFH